MSDYTESTDAELLLEVIGRQHSADAAVRELRRRGWTPLRIASYSRRPLIECTGEHTIAELDALDERAARADVLESLRVGMTFGPFLIKRLEDAADRAESFAELAPHTRGAYYRDTAALHREAAAALRAAAL